MRKSLKQVLKLERRPKRKKRYCKRCACILRSGNRRCLCWSCGEKKQKEEYLSGKNC